MVDLPEDAPAFPLSRPPSPPPGVIPPPPFSSPPLPLARLPYRRALVPLELKSGAPQRGGTPRDAHRAQVLLYALMMGNAYDANTSAHGGLIFYLRTGDGGGGGNGLAGAAGAMARVRPDMPQVR